MITKIFIPEIEIKGLKYRFHGELIKSESSHFFASFAENYVVPVCDNSGAEENL